MKPHVSQRNHLFIPKLELVCFFFVSSVRLTESQLKINVLLESDGGRPCLKEQSVVLGRKTQMIFLDPATFLASNCVLGLY